MTQLTRRHTLALLGAAAVLPGAAQAFEVADHLKPTLVDVDPTLPMNTIYIVTSTHHLYFIEAPGRARRYGVGVGKAGLAFKGEAEVARKAKWPKWTPTPDMIRRDPGKYERWADGMEGGPTNPLGARALYLYKDGRDTLFRIHGTTAPQTIGRSVSNGCIRMVNDHVIELYDRVPIGTKVRVL